MAECFNIYLDESCHLEHDRISVMTLGAVWCPADKVREVSLRIRDIRRQHRLGDRFEIKWTKVSPAKCSFYEAVLDYFLDDDDLHFRGVIIPDKAMLDHAAFEQTHDDWYYKMCFRLLEQRVRGVDQVSAQEKLTPPHRTASLLLLHMVDELN